MLLLRLLLSLATNLPFPLFLSFSTPPRAFSVSLFLGPVLSSWESDQTGRFSETAGIKDRGATGTVYAHLELPGTG